MSTVFTEAETEADLNPIERFAGEYAWLSNMFEAPCEHAGLTFKSSEHLYQWLKTAPGLVARPDLRSASWEGG